MRQICFLTDTLCDNGDCYHGCIKMVPQGDWLTPSGHAYNCGWHLDQYDHECDCGLVAATGNKVPEIGNKVPVRNIDKAVEEARAHLGAALVQSIPSDDQIIMDHVRKAFVLLGGAA